MHHPVLYHETIQALNPQPGGLYVDGTVGAGGHAFGILDTSNPDSRLLGLDLDPQALSLAAKKLHHFGNRVILQNASYRNLGSIISDLGWTMIDGILLDLGVSSMQLDSSERGFSFRQDGPLDMRFDPQSDRSAADLVNELPEQELADLIYRYGEERNSRRVARAIVAARPLWTTLGLADVIATATSSGKPGVHPATRTFQALRIAVNDELGAVEAILPQAMKVLAPGGRLAIIAFHSLEDRIVKQYFRRESRDCLCPPKQPVCTCDHRAILKELHRKPIQPGNDEILANPRSRSSRLRTAEKL
jgi:16S rRNA (cytosine1402-N4)-methyltransferase